MTVRKMGRVFVPDKRDLKYRLRLGAVASSRRYRWWRCGPVLDQGSESSCVGQAWAGWLQASPCPQNPLSPSGIYKIAQKYDVWAGESYDGTSVRAGAKVVTMTGQVEQYEWTYSTDDVVEYLLEHGPLVLGTAWTSGMSSPDRHGVIKLTGAMEGGHAYLAYGVNLNRGLVYLRNSWGRGWGLNGNARISLEDLQQLLNQDGECCVAREKIL